jgi:hypothetical protein
LKIYKDLDFSMNDIYNAIGGKTSIHDVEKDALMAR